MKFRLNNEEATFNICRSMKHIGEIQMVPAIYYIVKSVSKVLFEERLGVDALPAVIMNFDIDGIEGYDSLVAALELNEYQSKPKKLKLDMKYLASPPIRASIVEAPKLELKDLPPHLRYVFFGRDYSLPVMIASKLNGQEVDF